VPFVADKPSAGKFVPDSAASGGATPDDSSSWGKAAIRAGADIAKAPAALVDLIGNGPALDERLHRSLFGEPQKPRETLVGDINSAENKYAPLPPGSSPTGEKLLELLASVPTAMLGGEIGEGGEESELSQVERAAKQPELRGRKRAIKGGESIGMRATPGEKLDSGPLRQFEARLASHPATSGPFFRLNERNQGVLNRASARELGEQEPVLDEVTLGRAADRLSNVFEQAHDPNAHLPVDPKETNQFLDDLDEKYGGLLSNDKKVSDNELVKRLRTEIAPSEGKDLVPAGGPKAEYKVSAQKLGRLSSKLGKRAFKEMSTSGGDRDLGQALYDVKEHVDNLLERNMTPEGKQAFSTGRAQYRRLMQFLKRGVVNPSTGDVSGRSLANELSRSDRSGFTFGKNDSDLYKAARFSQATKPIGDSGTATRSADLKEMLMSLPGGMASSAYLNAPRVLGNRYVQALGLQGFAGLEPYLSEDQSNASP
jgi:hypothetical protein